MKKIALMFGLLIFFSTGLQAITFSGACENFIPAHLMGKIIHVERNGICFIDNQSDLDDLMFDDEKTAKMHELLDSSNVDNRVVPLFIGSSRALLVNSDELYVMEAGNEQATQYQTRHYETPPPTPPPAVTRAAATIVGGAIAGSAGGAGGMALGAAGAAVSTMGNCSGSSSGSSSDSK